MISNLKKYGKYIGAMAGILAMSVLPAGCNSKDDIAVPTVSYGPEIGFADGNVDLSGDSPVIDISNIKSPVGENIDFLSGVKIANEEAFADLEVWADASLVDIFTPGNYTATYTFNYDGKSISKDITVTIFEPETEQSASETAGDDTGNNNKKPSDGSENKTSGSGNSDNSGTTIQQGSSSNTTPPASTPGPSENKTTTPNGSSENNATTSGGSSGNNATTPANPTTTLQNPTTPQATSSTREIITTKGNSTTESKNIGNYTIELLSGKTITIKNTTSKYIVSTRTDVTTITKNDKTYRVSKLIITYNTGAEQVLETLEERIK